MKSIFFIILTLFIIRFAAKAAPIVVNDPTSNEKATPSKNVAMPLVMSAPNHYHLNEGEYIKLKQSHQGVVAGIFPSKFPRHHSKACHHAAHRKLSYPAHAAVDYLDQQINAIPQSVPAPVHISPINNQSMNEQELIFYRKLQRLKLA